MATFRFPRPDLLATRLLLAQALGLSLVIAPLAGCPPTSQDDDDDDSAGDDDDDDDSQAVTCTDDEWNERLVCITPEAGDPACSERDDAWVMETAMEQFGWNSEFECSEVLSVFCGPDSSTTEGDCCWTVEVSECDVGRPFLIEGEKRHAPCVERGDWHARLTPEVDHLHPSQRAALAAHWSLQGQMEHASVAAFARFALQLMAVGAPAELLRLTQQAMVDEQRHAEQCFGIAAAFAGAPVGPGPLDLDGSLGDCADLAAIVIDTFREGCIGETQAALIAQASRDACQDPVLRDVLAGIADDEMRHAELAWHFVEWALEQGDAAWRASLLDQLEAARQEAQRSLAAEEEAGRLWHAEIALRRHGRLPAAEMRLIGQATLEEVVGPLLDGLRTVRLAA